MKHAWRPAITLVLLALLCLPYLCLGCGGEEPSGRVVIRIGQITDFTGISAPSLVPLNSAVEDVARYFNEHEMIPGAQLKVISYNEMSDYSRDIPGYEKLKEQGAQLIITLLPTTGEILKPYSEKDHIPLTALGGSTPLITPPGWQFWFNCPPANEAVTLLEWLTQNDPGFPQGRPAKIGLAAWDAPFQKELKATAEAYCKAHSDQYYWVGGYLTPIGSVTWAGEVEKLKDCDYILRGAIAQATAGFCKQYADKGYNTTYLGMSAMTSFKGFILDYCGWDILDGAYSDSVCPWWTEEGFALVDLAKQVLNEYRAGEAEELIHSGTGYLGGFHNMFEICQVIQQAVDTVGVDNFDSQAFYDAALAYRTGGEYWVNYPEWSFGPDKRFLADNIRVYEWSKEAGDLVVASDGWITLKSP